MNLTVESCASSAARANLTRPRASARWRRGRCAMHQRPGPPRFAAAAGSGDALISLITHPSAKRGRAARGAIPTCALSRLRRLRRLRRRLDGSFHSSGSCALHPSPPLRVLLALVHLRSPRSTSPCASSWRDWTLRGEPRIGARAAAAPRTRGARARRHRLSLPSHALAPPRLERHASPLAPATPRCALGRMGAPPRRRRPARSSSAAAAASLAAYRPRPSRQGSC